MAQHHQESQELPQEQSREHLAQPQPAAPRAGLGGLGRSARRCVAGLVALAALGPAAAFGVQAQQVQPAPRAQAEEQAQQEDQPRPSIFADRGLDADGRRLEGMLAGSWLSVDPVAFAEGDGPARRLRLSVVPVQTELLGRVLYAETAPEGEPWSPLRQAIFRVYRFGGTLRLRTYEFRDPDRAGALAGLWPAADSMPLEGLRPEELVATLDVDLEEASGGFAGQTPYPYPTAEYDAVQMTTRLSITPDRIVSEDTFYGPNGGRLDIAGSGPIAWRPAQPVGEVERDEDGLVTITFEPGNVAAGPAEDGDVVFLNYRGWLPDGTQFDSSYDRGVALRYVHPGRAIEGFTRGVQPTYDGMRRKLIIPPALAYGERAVGPIPANSSLVYEVHVVRLDRDDDEAEGGQGNGATGEPAGDGDAANEGGG